MSCRLPLSHLVSHTGGGGVTVYSAGAIAMDAKDHGSAEKSFKKAIKVDSTLMEPQRARDTVIQSHDM